MTHDLRPGDHVKVDRVLYWHHGIFLGNGLVAHYADPDGGKDAARATVRIDTLEVFSQGAQVWTVEHANAFPAKVVIQRALSKRGEKKYSLVSNNCEHFATWCAVDEASSAQVWKLVGVLFLAVGAMIGVVTLARSA